MIYLLYIYIKTIVFIDIQIQSIQYTIHDTCFSSTCTSTSFTSSICQFYHLNIAIIATSIQHLLYQIPPKTSKHPSTPNQHPKSTSQIKRSPRFSSHRDLLQHRQDVHPEKRHRNRLPGTPHGGHGPQRLRKNHVPRCGTWSWWRFFSAHLMFIYVY